jgi:UDP-N-acetyl-D-glucosamine dehydrogenase
VSVAKLQQRIESKRARVGVIGLGYVGLPLVREFCRAGYRVTGFDVDRAKIKDLLAGRSYIKHIPSSLVQSLLSGGKFTPTSDMNQLARMDAILICVPTPLTRMREPDMSYVAGTAQTIAKTLRRGQLVVLESTTYPGTTREVVLPILAQTGLKVERDFLLAFSPEREDPGRKDHTTRTIPKVVGGYGRRSLRAATALYGRVLDRVVPVSSCETAEACKILENVYRCVNIALVNELKILFDRMGLDVWEVIAAASSKPFGFQPFWPGPGLGGHCIPIDPFYLSWKAREYGQATRFIELAGEVNTAMPGYVVSKVAEALNRVGKPIRGSRVLVLGLAYKKDVDDIRESPSIELIERLRGLGARVSYNDPYVPRTHKQREHDLRLRSQPIDRRSLQRYDCVVISTDHSCYDYGRIVRDAKLVVDTRNATADIRRGRHTVVRA